jgi:hypothetical protein
VVPPRGGFASSGVQCAWTMVKQLRCVSIAILLNTVICGCSKRTPDDLEVFAAVINDVIRKPRETTVSA